MQRMETSGGFSTAILCLNGDGGIQDDGGQKHVAFDCCGLGCLVGAQTLEGPASPDQHLAYPAERAYEPALSPSRARPSLTRAHGPGLRGPPAIG